MANNAKISKTLNARIKRVLNDIIDVAYTDESAYMRDKYKAFSISIENNSLKHHGSYDPKTTTIKINNVYRGAGATIKTCLHELSHHIDYVQNGRTGHQKPFYLAYRRLIYASLDMGLTKKSDFDTTDASDSNKVYKMAEEYIPHPFKYEPPQEKILKVKNGYKQKEKLKEEGFSWNNIEQVWERESADEEEDKKLMKELDIKDFAYDKKPFRVDAIVHIYAEGNTYDVKEWLKARKFKFNPDNKLWLKKMPSDAIDRELDILRSDERYKDVQFGIYEEDKESL